MPLRLIAIALCLGLAFKNYWPSKFRIVLPIYWYVTLTFIMPFFFTFMLLKNNFSNIWVQNSMTALFFMILLLDWIGLFISLVVGILIALIFFRITTPHSHLTPDLTGIISAYLAVIGVGTLFIHNKNRLQNDKLQTMKAVGASIAHELRTPLRTISIGLSSIKKCLSAFQKADFKVLKNGSDSLEASESLYDSLSEIINRTESETKSAFTIIDMFLVKLNNLSTQVTQNAKIPISHCITEALRRYPFDLDEDKLVNFVNDNNFIFFGDETLVEHVIFNLLKNSLYYIKAAGKGEITIWCELADKYNELHFKDTGKGIDQKTLPYIFDRYYSKTYHGTGIGLTFCKMVMQSFSGEILCYSEENNYTEFILKFPKI